VSALVLKVQTNGDNRAYGRLVSLHQGRVRGFLRRLCRCPALADDLAQEVFVIAYQKLNGFQGNGSFEAWLCSIAYRCFLQQLRRQRREQQVMDLMAAEQQVSTGISQPVTEDQLDIERALQQIDPRESAAITLNYSLGFSHAEIAGIMQLPLGTVKTLINRGLRKLRTLIDETDKATDMREKAS